MQKNDKKELGVLNDINKSIRNLKQVNRYNVRSGK